MIARDPIDRLRQAADLVALTHPDLARWLSEALERAEDGEALEAALGLHPAWRARLRERRRDEAIRRIKAEHFPTVPAHRLHALLVRRRDLLQRLPPGARLSAAVVRRACASATATNAQTSARVF